jgi:hypothetical protein
LLALSPDEDVDRAVSTDDWTTGLSLIRIVSTSCSLPSRFTCDPDTVSVMIRMTTGLSWAMTVLTTLSSIL